MRLSGPSPAGAILEHIGPHANVVVPTANGEPVTIIDALMAEEARLTGVRIHQVFGLRSRDCGSLDPQRLGYLH
jgi:hypothetical protein